MPDIVDFVGGAIPIFLIIIVAVLIVSYIGSRYKVAGANEALIVSGQRDRGPDGQRNLQVKATDQAGNTPDSRPKNSVISMP